MIKVTGTGTFHIFHIYEEKNSEFEWNNKENGDSPYNNG